MIETKNHHPFFGRILSPHLSVLCECKVTPEEIRGETDCALCSFQRSPDWMVWWRHVFQDSVSAILHTWMGHTNQITFKKNWSSECNVMFVCLSLNSGNNFWNVQDLRAMMVFLESITSFGDNAHISCSGAWRSAQPDANTFQSDSGTKTYTWAMVCVPSEQYAIICVFLKKVLWIEALEFLS